MTDTKHIEWLCLAWKISPVYKFSFKKKVGTSKVYANYPMLSNSWHCNFICISKFHVKNTIFNEKQITEKQQQLLMFNKLKKKWFRSQFEAEIRMIFVNSQWFRWHVSPSVIVIFHIGSATKAIHTSRCMNPIIIRNTPEETA